MPMRLAPSTAAIWPMRDSAAIGEGVLHMMAERAVVHDMIQFDDAVVGRAQAPALARRPEGPSPIGVTT